MKIWGCGNPEQEQPKEEKINKNKHLVLGFYTIPLKVPSDRQTEEPFRVLDLTSIFVQNY